MCRQAGRRDGEKRARSVAYLTASRVKRGHKTRLRLNKIPSSSVRVASTVRRNRATCPATDGRRPTFPSPLFLHFFLQFLARTRLPIPTKERAARRRDRRVLSTACAFRATRHADRTNAVTTDRPRKRNEIKLGLKVKKERSDGGESRRSLVEISTDCDRDRG